MMPSFAELSALWRGYALEDAKRFSGNLMDARKGAQETAAMFFIAESLELAQAIEARSGETERLDPKGESAVLAEDAPEGGPDHG